MARRKRQKNSNQYSTDRPIYSAKEDKLGRAEFAKRLAKDIRDLDGEEAFTLALYGKWGSGKTSVKNLILSKLNSKRYKENNHIIELNAWQFSRTGNLTSAFFRELGLILESQDDSDNKKKRSKKLASYAKVVSLGGSAVSVFGTVGELAGVPLSGTAKKFGKGIKQAGQTLEAGGAALGSTADLEKKSVSDVKQELSDAMATLSRPIIVVIDDIDRLTTTEILEVMQLVKANADFPKLVYLLLFERSIVETALNEISGDRGREFLEKIVQVGFHIPAASTTSIESILFEGLDKSLSFATSYDRFDNSRWRKVYLNSISKYFENLRHVYRFLASFDFHCRHFTRAGGFEVNPIDLVVLEVLRVFEPDVYELIAMERVILTRDRGKRIFGSIHQDAVDSLLDRVTEMASKPNGEAVREIVVELFPGTRSEKVDKHGFVRGQQKWIVEARVCHPELFDKYFQLAIQSNDVSQTEIDLLFQSTGDEQAFKEQCKSLADRGLRRIAFQRLDAFKDQVPVVNLPILLKTLFDMSEEIASPRSGMFSDQDELTSATRIIFWGLKKIQEEEERFKMLRDAIGSSAGLILPMNMVSHEERINNRYDFLIDEERLPALKEIILQRIRDFATDGKLIGHPREYEILWRWSEWVDISEVREWISSQLKKPKHAARFLELTLSEVTSHLGSRYHIKLENVERFADLQQLRKLTSKTPKKISELQKTAIKEFNHALKCRDEGLPPPGQWPA